ncbi:MAG: aminoglycoside phosphotransferase [Rhizobacter sp.]|nr:aminoglycoside phosphotransferase [Rhizobacter sp.]
MTQPSASFATPDSVPWPDAVRRHAFEHWLQRLGHHRIDASTLRVASADASFRRYLRVDTERGTRIVMDAPPAHEDCRPFVAVSALLRGAGLNAAEVIEWNEPDGFMLLSDLGDTTYLAKLGAEPEASLAAPFYADASAALVRLQGIAAEGQVPAYDRTLLARELQLFPDWYVDRHMGATLTDKEAQQWQVCAELILDTCVAQPSVLVHRDYHSRNLMVIDAAGAPGNPGILDFQDAVFGPITYDLVSLLRDAYLGFDEEAQLDLAIRWWERARRARLPVSSDFSEVWRDFEWMGLQRHLKVLGIFARLAHRDGKPAYLADLPGVWRHAHKVCTRYQGLGPLAHLLERLAGTTRESGYTF